MQQHAVMEFMTTEIVMLIDIHWQVKAVYGEECVDMNTVWLHMFMLGSLNSSP
jgi:hypothetical protein